MGTGLLYTPYSTDKSDSRANINFLFTGPDLLQAYLQLVALGSELFKQVRLNFDPNSADVAVVV